MTRNSTPGYISEKKNTLIWKDTFTQMFIAALFAIVKIQKQPVSINRLIDKEDVVSTPP